MVAAVGVAGRERRGSGRRWSWGSVVDVHGIGGGDGEGAGVVVGEIVGGDGAGGSAEGDGVVVGGPGDGTLDYRLGGEVEGAGGGVDPGTGYGGASAGEGLGAGEDVADLWGGGVLVVADWELG